MAGERKAIIKNLICSIIEDDDDSSDCEEIIIVKRKSKIEEIPRVSNYAEVAVLAMSENDFKSHFRVSSETVQFIQHMISEDVIFKNRVESLNVNLNKQILMTLWVLGNPDSFRSVSDRFGVSKSTLWFSFSRICSAIARLSQDFIRWPSVEEMNASALAFEAQAGFPGVVGCIGGTCISIQKKAIDPKVYCNRKSSHSFILQGIVNHNLEFINCYTGEVGSVNHASVFHSSKVGENLANKMPEHFHLLGDRAYPLSVNLITPFRDTGNLTCQQILFNKKHSATRIAIQRAFALLKCRFRRLKKSEMKKTDFIPTIIMAACVLHNISRRRGEDLEEEYENTEETDDEDDNSSPKDKATSTTGANKRYMLLQKIT